MAKIPIQIGARLFGTKTEAKNFARGIMARHSEGESIIGTDDLLPFEDRRQAYPDAERRDAARGAGASHLVDQRRGQADAAATKRVTDRNRAAVDVQFCIVDAQLALTQALLDHLYNEGCSIISTATCTFSTPMTEAEIDTLVGAFKWGFAAAST